MIDGVTPLAGHDGLILDTTPGFIYHIVILI
jgi:hypothetical protein